MNNRTAKRIRKEIRRRSATVEDAFCKFVNQLSFTKRIKLAFKIIIGKF